MEKLVELLNGPNAPMYVMLAVVVLFVAIMLSKRGVLGIHTKYVTLGATSREDTIKDHQMEGAYLFITGLEPAIVASQSAGTDHDKYKTKWILERVYDEVVIWIMHNHIRNNDVYVRQKADKVFDLIKTLGVRSTYTTEEFHSWCYEQTKILVERLVNTRNVYEQGGGIP